MSKRNRTAGHDWERKCAEILRTFFPGIVTSRSANLLKDAKKVDLVNADELRDGELPFNFQCKSTCNGANYHKILNDMPDGDNILLHQYKKKANKNFVTRGEYVVMTMDTFLKLLDK